MGADGKRQAWQNRSQIHRKLMQGMQVHVPTQNVYAGAKAHAGVHKMRLHVHTAGMRREDSDRVLNTPRHQPPTQASPPRPLLRGKKEARADIGAALFRDKIKLWASPPSLAVQGATSPTSGGQLA